MVKQLTHNPRFKSLNPGAAGTRDSAWENISLDVLKILTISFQVSNSQQQHNGQKQIHNPKFKGLNTAPANAEGKA